MGLLSKKKKLIGENEPLVTLIRVAQEDVEIKRHLLAILSQNKFNTMNLDKYNTLIMVNGQYKGITTKAQQKLKAWVEKGNTVIATKGGAKWLSDKKISKTKLVENMVRAFSTTELDVRGVKSNDELLQRLIAQLRK